MAPLMASSCTAKLVPVQSTVGVSPGEARACFAGGFALETCPINYPWRYTRHIERSKPSSQPSELKPLQLNNRVMLHTAHPVDISRDASLSAGERDATMM